jgi:PII-like signaling protein
MLQLRFHFGERDRDGDGPLDAAVMDACERRGVRVAALLRGVEGFGAKHRLRTDRLLSLSEDAPLVAVAVGKRDVIEGLADEVREIADEGLIALEPVGAWDGGARTTGTTTCIAGEAVAPVVGAPVEEGRRDVVKATIWGPRTGPEAPHLEAVDALRRRGAESATVLLGVDGVLEGERRRARFIAGNRGVPALTVAMGERVAIEAALAEVDGAAHLVTVEGVERNRRHATVSLHGGASGAAAAATRVTLVTSEIARDGSHPRYVELIHELRRRGAAGATALRGVWGFRGDRAPRGDRALALRRDVPVIVEAVDSPERTEEWRELAVSLAGEDDVVHSERLRSVVTLQ